MPFQYVLLNLGTKNWMCAVLRGGHLATSASATLSPFRLVSQVELPHVFLVQVRH